MEKTKLFIIDGIKYNIIDVTNKTVEVGHNPSCTLAEVTIPEKVEYKGVKYSVTRIGDFAFEFSNLTHVNISNTITSIGEGAFYLCTKLTLIEIPNSVESIEYGAFEDCKSLTLVKIPKSVKYIGRHAFDKAVKIHKV